MSSEEVVAEAGSSSARKSMSEHWRELAEERGFSWPEKDEEFSRDLREAMDEPDGVKMIEKYRRLCRHRISSTGEIRLELFLLISIKNNFMSPEQYYGAKERVDSLFELGNPTVAFFFNHVVTSQSLEKFQCKALHLDNVYTEVAKKEENNDDSGDSEDNAEEKDEKVEQDGEKDDEKEEDEEEEKDSYFASNKAMMMAFGEIEIVIADWMIAFIVFAQEPAKVLSMNDSAKLHSVTMMDTMFPGCTLADVDVAMRGVDFMHIYHTIKEGDRFQRLGYLSAKDENRSVRACARLSKVIDTGRKDGADPRISFGKSFQSLVAYIVCECPPNIPREDVENFDYTTRSELLLARTLRRFRREERKRLIKKKEMTKSDKVAITIPEQVLLQVERVARVGKNGERRLVPGELYARLKSVSLECAIAWLYCAMANSESVLDWYWFMEGANVYSKFRENRALFDQIEKAVEQTRD
jgi:hypothetical protein